MTTTENAHMSGDADPQEGDVTGTSPENPEAANAGEEAVNMPNDDTGQLRAENAELRDQLLRTQAELENFRRRTQKESVDALKYQSLPVIRDLLPGLDNLRRAIDAAEQSGDTQSLIQGISMVGQQFLDVLKAHSVVSINPEGESFDPNYHEALSQVPSADHEPMTVLQVIDPGYRIHDRVIRPAKVIVTSAAASDPPASDNNAESDSAAT